LTCGAFGLVVSTQCDECLNDAQLDLLTNRAVWPSDTMVAQASERIGRTRSELSDSLAIFEHL
jgi:hypothetical protein